MKNVLKEQPTPEKPYIVESYPYGRLRTQARFYIERTKHGERWVKQTLNPKTKKWNKPKKSTYSYVLLAYINEEGHIKSMGFSPYDVEKLRNKYDTYKDYLDEWQDKEIRKLIKYGEVTEKIEYVIKERRFKNIHTGEITTRVPALEFNDYKEVDENGDYIDQEKEREKERQKNIAVNKVIVAHMATVDGVKSSIETFNRLK